MRKAFAGDILFGVLGLFFLFVMIFFSRFIFTGYYDATYDSLPTVSQEVLDLTDENNKNMDWWGVALVIALLITIIALVALIPSYPILVVPLLLVIVVSVVISGDISNLFMDISNDTFVNESVEFPLSVSIGNNFPLLAFFFGIVFFLSLFIVWRLFQ